MCQDEDQGDRWWFRNAESVHWHKSSYESISEICDKVSMHNITVLNDREFIVVRFASVPLVTYYKRMRAVDVPG